MPITEVVGTRSMLRTLSLLLENEPGEIYDVPKTCRTLDRCLSYSVFRNLETVVLANQDVELMQAHNTKHELNLDCASSMKEVSLPF